jgi:tRNA 5-methylaminomethyl-2-thiouridine biosynthesis bifunctional protein
MYSISPANLSYSNETTPTSTDYDDVYFMPNHAFAEIDFVSLRGNGLHERFMEASNFTIAELGFGTGLNFHLTNQLWRKMASKDAKLTYISIEKHPINADDLANLHEKLGIAKNSQEWRTQYPLPIYGVYTLHLSHNVQLVLMFMEASDGVAQIADASVDSWFLDGFAPAKNPEMWSDDIMRGVARTLQAQGTFATFTAASMVRQSLQQHGLVVEKIKGYGCKRHMLIGNKP